MRFSILFCLVILFSGANADNEIHIYDEETCGRPSVLMQRFIRGGKQAEFFELPWSVRVNFALSEEQRNGDHELFTPCSGTLITRKHVLTVAHCLPPNFKNLPHENVVELIGASANVNRPLTYRVKRVRMYEKYLVSEPGNDIALLELENSVPRGIHHVCLPDGLFKIDEKSDVIHLSGTGDRMDGSNDVKLMKVELGKRNFDYQASKGEFVVENAYNKSGCHGDSGAGATSIINGQHVLVGMHRAGSCSIEGYEGPAVSIFTNVVSHFIEIVSKII